jgi:hypothetical protein
MKIPIEFIVLVASFFIAVIGFGFKVIMENTKAIESINVVLAKILTGNMYEDKVCTTKHEYINDKLKSHSEKLEKHEIRIQNLEK